MTPVADLLVGDAGDAIEDLEEKLLTSKKGKLPVLDKQARGR